MNACNFAHALLAVGFQAYWTLIAWLTNGSLSVTAIVSGAMAIGFYYGREVAQVERKAGTPPWYSGFLPKNWSKDNFFDFVIPFLASILFVLLVVAIN